MGWWIAVFCFLILIITILLLPAELRLEGTVSKRSSFYLSFLILGHRIKTLNRPTADTSKERKKKKSSGPRKWYQPRLSLILDTFHRYAPHIRMRDLQVSGQIGLENPALTAVSIGVFYALGGILIRMLSLFAILEKVSLDLRPRYDKFEFALVGSCILRVRIVHIIGGLVRIYWLSFRIHLSAAIRKHKMKGRVQYV